MVSPETKGSKLFFILVYICLKIFTISTRYEAYASTIEQAMFQILIVAKTGSSLSKKLGTFKNKGKYKKIFKLTLKVFILG